MPKVISTEEFIERAKEIHHGKYNYDKTKYLSSNTEVIITCPVHGDFLQKPHVHLLGCGCPQCGLQLAKDKMSLGLLEFLKRANEVHNNYYDYSKVNYINSETKVIIICPIHGEFEQTPSNHLRGQGCPGCNSSRLEEQVQVFLNQNRIKFVYQKSWDWLIYKRKQFLDFYLPEYNVGIECQGIQHFTDEGIFEKSSGLEERSLRDINKQKLCAEHNIRILYFSNMSTKTNKFNYPYLVIEDLESLVLEIQKPFIWL